MKRNMIMSLILGVVLCSSSNSYSKDIVELFVRPTKDTVIIGESLNFEVGIRNAGSEDIYVFNMLHQMPIMWEPNKVVINFGMFFDRSIKGFCFNLPPVIKVKGSNAPAKEPDSKFIFSYINELPHRYKWWLEYPYYVRLKKINGSQSVWFVNENVPLTVFKDKYKLVKRYYSSKEEGEFWATDIELKEGVYEFVGVISYTDYSTIKYFQENLEFNGNYTNQHALEECMSWDKWVDYLEGRITTIFSQPVTVEILTKPDSK